MGRTSGTPGGKRHVDPYHLQCHKDPRGNATVPVTLRHKIAYRFTSTYNLQKHYAIMPLSLLGGKACSKRSDQRKS